MTEEGASKQRAGKYKRPPLYQWGFCSGPSIDMRGPYINSSLCPPIPFVLLFAGLGVSCLTKKQSCLTKDM